MGGVVEGIADLVVARQLVLAEQRLPAGFDRDGLTVNIRAIELEARAVLRVAVDARLREIHAGLDVGADGRACAHPEGPACIGVGRMGEVVGRGFRVSAERIVLECAVERAG